MPLIVRLAWGTLEWSWESLTEAEGGGQSDLVIRVENVTKSKSRLQTFNTDVVRFSMPMDNKRFVLVCENLPWTSPGSIQRVLLVFIGHHDMSTRRKTFEHVSSGGVENGLEFNEKEPCGVADVPCGVADVPCGVADVPCGVADVRQL